MGGMTAWLLKGVLTEESMVPQLSTLVSHPSMEADGVRWVGARSNALQPT